jgi:hypothetical protein
MMRSKRSDSGQSQPSNRYAAKLLFQFRVMVDGSPGVRRLCEERIILFCAADAEAAFTEAQRRGRAAKYRYKNSDDNPVHFEFVGVMQLLGLSTACESDEVWYDLVERVRPMERRSVLIPPKIQLCAIRNRE